MAIRGLTEDCFVNLLSFLPCPLDRKNLIEALQFPQSNLAITQQIIWRKWKNLDLIQPQFISDPDILSIILDYVSSFRSVRVQLSKQKNEVQLMEIIDGIMKSESKNWNADKLSVDVQSIGYSEEIFVDLMKLVVDRIGNCVTDVKFHVNERPRRLCDSAIQVLFDRMISTENFQKTTSLDLNAFGRRVSNDLSQVLVSIPIKELSLCNISYLPENCLAICITSLESLFIYHCSGLSIRNMIRRCPEGGYSNNMRGASFCCKTIEEGLQWIQFGQKAISHCDCTVKISDPMNCENGPEDENVLVKRLKHVIRLYVEFELLDPHPQNVTHLLMIGSVDTPVILMRDVADLFEKWIAQFGLKLDMENKRWKYSRNGTVLLEFSFG